MNENLDIFIYSHKPFKPAVTNKVYKVLTNTKEDIDTELEVYRDYVGDNIGDKNLMYNEYTGLYWLWKNYDLKDYVGLNHYRRYYSFMDDVPDIESRMKAFKLCLNRPIDLTLRYANNDSITLNNREWYKFWHNIEDFDIFCSMMRREFPEYKKGLKRMSEATYLYNSSMFIMPKDMYNEYCEYIFDVLDAFNEEVGLFTSEDYIKHVETNKDKYIKDNLKYYDVNMQSRVIGYIAERALNTFILNGDKETLEDNALILDWKMIK